MQEKRFRRGEGFTETALLHSAADHLASAKVLFNKNPRCFDSAGYLCHLGIELVLKAILLAKCHEFPNYHSLVKLSNLIEKQGAKMNYGRNHSRAIAMLDGFSQLRYPDSSNPIEIGDDDWDSVEALFEFLIFKLPEDVQNELRQMDHSKKGNRILMRRKKTAQP